VRVLLDREKDSLAFEFITDEDVKAKTPPKKPKAEEEV
jgi:hypothetical protein